MELKDIINIVSNRLSEKRFFHSKCVMERCEELANKFGIDTDMAKKVGIAHDIAKEIDNDEKIKLAEKNNIEIDETEHENPTLLHAKLGEYIALTELDFTPEMGHAIRAHTTGLPNMSMLDKILFIADRTSKERGFSDIDYLNNLLEQSIDKAVLYIMNKKIMLQIEKNATMHINSIIARNYLLKNGNL